MLYKIIILVLFTFSINSFAQEQAQVQGEWLLDKMATKGNYQDVGQLVNFNQDGKLFIQDIPFGTWTYNKKEKLLNMQAQNLSGGYEVAFLSATNMQLTLDNKDLYFTKIDREKMVKENAASGLIGLWEYANDLGDNMHRIIQFKAPDKIILIEKDANMESRYSGIWLYQAELNQLIIIGQLQGIRGINSEVTITPNEVNFLHKTKSTTLKKVKQDATNIEHLSFTTDDFYDKTGDYKYYDDDKKLPWKDYYQMLDDLTNVKQLIYKEATLVEGTKSFETKILKADVKANLNKEFLQIDAVFNGYDRYNLPDDTAFPSNVYNQYASKLYPYKDVTYRVKGTDDITVPAGTYNCTVVEAIDNFDEKIKIWMINNKPGIIAKIIKEKSGSFGYYIRYELQEIKTN